MAFNPVVHDGKVYERVVQDLEEMIVDCENCPFSLPLEDLMDNGGFDKCPKSTRVEHGAVLEYLMCVGDHTQPPMVWILKEIDDAQPIVN